MSSSYDWSLIAINNQSSDSGINWLEGQDPGTVNGSARAMMGRNKEILGDIGGALTAGGTANALTVTANSAFTAYADGLVIALRIATDNSGAATLNVNGIGAKAIRKMVLAGEAALAGGELQATGIYILMYQSALNAAAGAWLVLNPTLDTSSFLTAASAVPAAITGTGALNAGSITSGFGAIDIGADALTAGAATLASMASAGAVSGTTGTFSGATSGTIVTSTTAFRAAAGSFGTPSISFTGDPDTGLYSYNPNEMGFAVNGAFLANMTATGFNFGRALSDPTLAGITMQANGQLVVGMDANNAIFNRFTSDGTMIQFRRTNSTVGTIAVTTVATAYNTSSDARLKSELREFDSGAILDGLSFGEFTWLKDGSVGYGVLAQDAKEVLPQAVFVDDEGWHSVDYSKFVPVLAAELKALRKRLADLEEAT